MKKISIIGFIPTSLKFHQQTLCSIFQNDVIVDIMSIAQSKLAPTTADVLVCTSPIFAEQTRRYASKGTVVIFADYTLESSILSKIENMGRTGPISVIAPGYRIALSRKMLLEQLGIEKQFLSLWHDGIKDRLPEHNVVVFGEAEVPNEKEHYVLRIESRNFSVSTIIQIALSLDQVDVLRSDAFLNYYKQMVISPQNTNNVILQSEDYSFMNDTLARGVLSFTEDYTIAMCDAYIMEITGLHYDILIEQKVYDVFPFLKKYIYDGTINEYHEKVENYKGKDYIVTVSILSVRSTFIGYIRFEDYSKEEKRQTAFRRQISFRKQKAKYTFADIVGQSIELCICKNIALKAACSKANILLIGDTGTGKELFAQAIHNASARHQNPFIAVNCGAFVESLLESELFGYEKGAFTGANKEGKRGLFELADGGTLFLDEIGDMPLGLQVKLLRVLQEKEVVRVGGEQVIPVNVRIIAATNRDLYQMVKEKTFRADLFYRINVISILIPPLKKRKDDIKDLITYFMVKKNYFYIISNAAMKKITSYDFPGNIRELQNCVDYMESLGVTCIEEDDLPPYILQETEHSVIQNQQPSSIELSQQDMDVLFAIESINQLGLGAGRRSVREVLLRKEQRFSERKLRIICTHLEKQGLINICQGRAGMEVTPLGKNILSKHLLI